MALNALPGQPLFLLPAVLRAVQRINRAIQSGVAADTVKELMCPEAQLPPVHPFASAVYQQELEVLQRQQQGVSPRNESPSLGFPSSERDLSSQSEGTLTCWQEIRGRRRAPSLPS